MHNIFHVSLLKEYVPDPLHLLNDEDTVLVNQEEFQMTPEQILEIKERKLRHKKKRSGMFWFDNLLKIGGHLVVYYLYLANKNESSHLL